eukprot:TCALIF_03896-PA protein Name:"Protein of unknown function" AED:0.12 eAED:0.12 QI:0/0/0.5/0.5/1/1/2/89/427
MYSSYKPKSQESLIEESVEEGEEEEEEEQDEEHEEEANSNNDNEKEGGDDDDDDDDDDEDARSLLAGFDQLPVKSRIGAFLQSFESSEVSLKAPASLPSFGHCSTPVSKVTPSHLKQSSLTESCDSARSSSSASSSKLHSPGEEAHDPNSANSSYFSGNESRHSPQHPNQLVNELFESFRAKARPFVVKEDVPKECPPYRCKSPVDQFDFRSRLKKTSIGSDSGRGSSEIFTLGSLERKSSCEDLLHGNGSIVSLKKIWEPVNGAKAEKRVWPPIPSTKTKERPMVPVKPTLKVKDPIYAAPSVLKDDKLSAVDEQPPLPVVAPDTVLKEGDVLRKKLQASKIGLPSCTNITELSNDLLSFHGLNERFVDNIPATARFRFRSLLNELELEAKNLRVNAIKNAESNVLRKCVAHLDVSLKELLALVAR